MSKCILIAAIAKNGVIGKGDSLPWSIKSELTHFKRSTMGNIVMFGRNTWNSLPIKPLPDRLNVIITRRVDEGLKLRKEWPGVDLCYDPQHSIASYKKQYPDKDIYICGGALIYRHCIVNNLVDELLISHMKDEYDGDIFFPSIDLNQWESKIEKELSKFSVIRYSKGV